MLLVNGEQEEGDERETISNTSLSSPPGIITLTLTRRLHLATVPWSDRSQRGTREKRSKMAGKFIRITHGVLENWMIRYEWSNERGFTANQDCQRELEDMSIRFLVEEFEKRLEDNVSSGKQRHLDASLSGAYGKLEQV